MLMRFLKPSQKVRQKKSCQYTPKEAPSFMVVLKAEQVMLCLSTNREGWVPNSSLFFFPNRFFQIQPTPPNSFMAFLKTKQVLCFFPWDHQQVYVCSSGFSQMQPKRVPPKSVPQPNPKKSPVLMPAASFLLDASPQRRRPGAPHQKRAVAHGRGRWCWTRSDTSARPSRTPRRSSGTPRSRLFFSPFFFLFRRPAAAEPFCG